jgi:hypothetical protein
MIQVRDSSYCYIVIIGYRNQANMGYSAYGYSGL